MRKGRFLVIIGPDGVGKTSLAHALLENWPGERAYFHFRPPRSHPMRDVPPRAGIFIGEKRPMTGSRPAGWLRLALNLIRFWLGYIATVRPALRRGALVVGDRWAYGYLAQPGALKYHGPEWLARLALVAMPQPDLVVRLTAPADLVHSRKRELTEDQIRAEDARWAGVRSRRQLTLHATVLPEKLAEKVFECL